MIAEDAAALERVTAAREEWPDGTYGGARRLRRVPGQPDPDATEHLQELAEAIATWRLGDRADRPWTEAS